MNRQKLKNIELHASIDTFSIVSPDISAQMPGNTEYLNDMRVLQNGGADCTYFQYIINPNKARLGDLYRFSDFKKVISYILCDMEIMQYYKNRVDFRIDSYQNDYDELLKLNKCIILLLSLRYKVKNRYQSFDPLSLDSLTIRIQNRYLEAENYNKAIEEPDGDVKNRLELRSKSIAHDKDIPVLIEEWGNRLNALIGYYGELQAKCNTALIKRWEIEKGIQVKTLSEFIRKYQGNIFCRKQLIAFYRLVGASNPTKAADNFKAKNRIEYFSLNDLKMYLKTIVAVLDKYLHK